MQNQYDELHLTEKALHHLRQAEEHQKRVDYLEALAAERADNDETVAYLLTHDEALAFPYKKAVGNRNGHRDTAIMYGIVALLEKLSA